MSHDQAVLDHEFSFNREIIYEDDSESSIISKNFFFQLGFTPCKAEQPLQEKKHKKITGYRKSV